MTVTGRGLQSAPMMRYRKAAVMAALVLGTTAAHADVVWPALYLEVRSFAWWAISSGLLIEWLVVKRAFALGWKRSAVATLVANGVSSLLGMLFIPFAGFAWGYFPGPLYQRTLPSGAASLITCAATYLMAVLINSLFESWVYEFGFKVPMHRREVGWTIVANALSVGVAFGSLFIVPV